MNREPLTADRIDAATHDMAEDVTASFPDIEPEELNEWSRGLLPIKEHALLDLALSNYLVHQAHRSGCFHPDHSAYPLYGMAPHRHDMQRTGSYIGSTVTDPPESWPANFCEDEPGAGMGMWFCPGCFGKTKVQP